MQACERKKHESGTQLQRLALELGNVRRGIVGGCYQLYVTSCVLSFALSTVKVEMLFVKDSKCC